MSIEQQNIFGTFTGEAHLCSLLEGKSIAPTDYHETEMDICQVVNHLTLAIHRLKHDKNKQGRTNNKKLIAYTSQSFSYRPRDTTLIVHALVHLASRCCTC
jgi:hypothetical protein